MNSQNAQPLTVYKYVSDEFKDSWLNHIRFMPHVYYQTIEGERRDPNECHFVHHSKNPDLKMTINGYPVPVIPNTLKITQKVLNHWFLACFSTIKSNHLFEKFNADWVIEYNAHFLVNELNETMNQKINNLFDLHAGTIHYYDCHSEQEFMLLEKAKVEKLVFQKVNSYQDEHEYRIAFEIQKDGFFSFITEDGTKIENSNNKIEQFEFPFSEDCIVGVYQKPQVFAS